MISYLEALQAIIDHSNGNALTPIWQASQQALGYTSAEAVVSPENIPNFHNSAMDGFALKSSDTLNANAQNPVELSVLECIGAGSQPEKQGRSGTCMEIMTGAILPDGYDAVVRVEDIKRNIENNAGLFSISINKPLKTGENVRYLGEDFAIGDRVISANEVLGPEHLMALATLGIRQIKVRPQPKIRIICTGNELVDINTPFLAAGKIRNSNAAYLQAVLANISNCQYVHSSDEPALFMDYMTQEMQASPDIIITTGAVSAGKWDFIPTVLKEIGAEIIFHKVNIRPGKPILFAKLKNTFIFSLPGNPVSTMVGLRFFVYPLLCQLQMLSMEKPLVATLTHDVMKKTTMRHFLKARFYIDNTGQAQVSVNDGQESFKISPLLSANCWAVLNEEQEKFLSGEKISIYPLYPWNTLWKMS